MKEIDESEPVDQPEAVDQLGGSTCGSTVSAYLGLGSNLGDRESHMREAVNRIRSLGLILARSSSIYETEPVGYQDQPWFLNQVVELRIRREEWSGAPRICAGMPDVQANSLKGSERERPSGLLLQAEALLHELQTIEAAIGRERQMPNGPRVIDIDLLLFGELVVGAASREGERSEEIRVPHPRMHLRRFVLQPLCEIAPDLVHPVLGRTCCELLAAVGDRAAVRIYG